MTTETTAQAGTGDAGASADTGAAAAKDTATIVQTGGTDAGKVDTTKAASVDDKGAAAAATDAAPDWRARMAGDDKAALKELERYNTEADFYKSNKELRRKLSSGEYKRALGADATDEEKAAWRKEQGIPDKAEGYIEKLELPKGLVLGEADKPLAAEFASGAAEANMTPAQYSVMVAKYYAIQDAMKAKQDEADTVFKETTLEQLRDEWGPDYKRNLNAASNLVAAMPGKLADRLLSGRTADGRRIGDDPEMLAWLSSQARELNPMATLVPAGTSNAVAAGQARIAEIEKMMSDRSGEYYRGPNSAKIQQEYRDLLTARDTMKARAA